MLAEEIRRKLSSQYRHERDNQNTLHVQHAHNFDDSSHDLSVLLTHVMHVDFFQKKFDSSFCRQERL